MSRCDCCGGTGGAIDREAHVDPALCIRALQRQVSEACGTIAELTSDVAGTHVALDAAEVARTKRSVLPEFDPTTLNTEGRAWLLVSERNRLCAERDAAIEKLNLYTLRLAAWERLYLAARGHDAACDTEAEGAAFGAFTEARVAARAQGLDV